MLPLRCFCDYSVSTALLACVVLHFHLLASTGPAIGQAVNFKSLRCTTRQSTCNTYKCLFIDVTFSIFRFFFPVLEQKFEFWFSLDRPYPTWWCVILLNARESRLYQLLKQRVESFLLFLIAVTYEKKFKVVVDQKAVTVSSGNISCYSSLCCVYLLVTHWAWRFSSCLIFSQPFSLSILSDSSHIFFCSFQPEGVS